MKGSFILPSSHMGLDLQFGLELNFGSGDSKELKLEGPGFPPERKAVEELSRKLEFALWKKGQAIFFFLNKGCLEFNVKLYVLLY